VINRLITISDDGSHTIYNENIDEHYHSKFGAITESVHVFIHNGMNYLSKNDIRILEIGFGTGLNAFLSCSEALNKNKILNYTGIELYPLDTTIIEKLNYPLEINPELANEFIQMHKCSWGIEHQITPYFSFTKINKSAIDFEPCSMFDVIFFDSFSPEKQLELWSVEMFTKLYKALNSGGVLTTYCAKGIVKRALREAGFKVEVLPGPPGKRHIIRALKVF
jgi:tRNA U34 5-methylaminomethyl-2-thiouridine-forming methyltransferase MnmC